MKKCRRAPERNVGAEEEEAILSSAEPPLQRCRCSNSLTHSLTLPLLVLGSPPSLLWGKPPTSAHLRGPRGRSGNERFMLCSYGCSRFCHGCAVNHRGSTGARSTTADPAPATEQRKPLHRGSLSLTWTVPNEAAVGRRSEPSHYICLTTPHSPRLSLPGLICRIITVASTFSQEAHAATLLANDCEKTSQKHLVRVIEGDHFPRNRCTKQQNRKVQMIATLSIWLFPLVPPRLCRKAAFQTAARCLPAKLPLLPGLPAVAFRADRPSHLR